MPVEPTMRGLEDLTPNYEDGGRVRNPGDVSDPRGDAAKAAAEERRSVEAYEQATASVETQPVALCGDVAGHEFHGNQWSDGGLPKQVENVSHHINKELGASYTASPTQDGDLEVGYKSTNTEGSRDKALENFKQEWVDGKGTYGKYLKDEFGVELKLKGGVTTVPAKNKYDALHKVQFKVTKVDVKTSPDWPAKPPKGWNSDPVYKE